MNMMPPDRFLRLNVVLDRTGLSRARLYRRVDNLKKAASKWKG
ncbi:hypothetical protein [Novosphingobium sp.]|jgi:prophage regulatory protein